MKDNYALNNVEPKSIENDKKNEKLSGSWILWWLIGKNELEEQVTRYEHLGILNSIRGQSYLLLIISAIFSSIILLGTAPDIMSWIDISVFVILAMFIKNGKRWAMVLTMLLLTDEKWHLAFLYANEAKYSSIIMPLFWWCVYMHALWFAYRVESERKKRRML